MSEADTKASKALRAIAVGLDHELEQVAGEHLGFCLIVLSSEDGGQSSYVANTERAATLKAMKDLLSRWEQGMQDVPAHEKH